MSDEHSDERSYEPRVSAHKSDVFLEMRRVRKGFGRGRRARDPARGHGGRRFVESVSQRPSGSDEIGAVRGLDFAAARLGPGPWRQIG
jgi:hypothetical protein